MKVYVETKRGFPVNSDIQKAIDGFESLCYDIVPFQHSDIVLGRYDYAATKNVFVGSIDTMKLLFNRIGKTPEDINYPQFLFDKNLLTRKISKSILKDVIDNYSGEEVFIKPIKTKLFDGMLVTKKDDFNYFKGYENEPVWISDKMDIASEWRVFVHDDKIVHWSNYSGDFTKLPDFNYVSMLRKYYTQQFDNAPRSYTIDVAVLKDVEDKNIGFIKGRTDVVEFNDFWAIGSYGLDCVKYAEMLRDRYKEIAFEN
jgi:hypothetical protein